MNPATVTLAAQIIWQNWMSATCIEFLPDGCRPANRREAYAIQAELEKLSGQRRIGWKIAATSIAGQQHIGVDGPLAGRLFADRVLTCGTSFPLTGTRMRVAEAEFTFRFAQSLPKRTIPYNAAEVIQAVDSLHCAIELPDSRYHDFARVGAPQLIADNACACWFLAGDATCTDWRTLNLVEHQLTAYLNGKRMAEGIGANALGDPRTALTWLVNELNVYGEAIQAGEIVTTGTCIKPVPVAPGDHLRVDFGILGEIEAAFE